MRISFLSAPVPFLCLPILLILIVSGCHSRDKAGEVLENGTRPKGTGVLIVMYAPDSADTFAASSADSVLVLEWLEKSCARKGVDLGVTTYPFGTLVMQIGTRRNGAGGNWLYKVNGQMIPEAASAHRVSSADTVVLFFDH